MGFAVVDQTHCCGRTRVAELSVSCVITHVDLDTTTHASQVGSANIILFTLSARSALVQCGSHVELRVLGDLAHAVYHVVQLSACACSSCSDTCGSRQGNSSHTVRVKGCDNCTWDDCVVLIQQSNCRTSSNTCCAQRRRHTDHQRTRCSRNGSGFNYTRIQSTSAGQVKVCGQEITSGTACQTILIQIVQIKTSGNLIQINSGSDTMQASSSYATTNRSHSSCVVGGFSGSAYEQSTQVSRINLRLHATSEVETQVLREVQITANIGGGWTQVLRVGNDTGHQITIAVVRSEVLELDVGRSRRRHASSLARNSQHIGHTNVGRSSS